MSKKTIRIANIESEPSTKKLEHLPVRLVNETRTYLPVGIVNGSNDGPVLCLVAGHHGLEYAGIEAVIRTYKRANPKELHGAIITVPVVNVLGFQTRTPYLCPIDGVNIARVYPGDANGSLSYVIAHIVLNDIIAKADYAMDCHGGDLFESVGPFTLFCNGVNDKAVVAKEEGMAKAHGLPYYAVQRFGMKLMEEAPKRGVPTLLAEIGGQEWDGPSVDLHMVGIENVMKHLGMVKGTPKTQVVEDMSSHKEFDVRSRCGGIWYPQVKAGDKVSSGQVLGEIRDWDAEVKETLHSPCSGIVHVLFTFHFVEPDSQIMRITSA
jgi:hypothetical protein